MQTAHFGRLSTDYYTECRPACSSNIQVILNIFVLELNRSTYTWHFCNYWALIGPPPKTIYCKILKLPRGNISTLYHYPDRRLCIISNSEYHYIVTWHRYCHFLVLMAALQSSDYLDLPECSSCSNTCPYPPSHYIHNTNVYYKHLWGDFKILKNMMSVLYSPKNIVISLWGHIAKPFIKCITSPIQTFLL